MCVCEREREREREGCSEVQTNSSLLVMIRSTRNYVALASKEKRSPRIYEYLKEGRICMNNFFIIEFFEHFIGLISKF